MTSLDVTSAGMSPGEVGCKIREHGDDLAAFRRYLSLAVLNPATVFRSFMLPVEPVEFLNGEFMSSNLHLLPLIYPIFTCLDLDPDPQRS